MIPTLFITGFILAGSFGPLFPWLNIAGCALAVAALTIYNAQEAHHG